jgi:two-component system response regulator
MNYKTTTLPAILVVDDLHDDLFFTRRAAVQAGIRNPMFTVATAQQAIHYLKGDGLYGDRAKYPLPGLMLLDLKMPTMSGFGVLEWLQGRPKSGAMAIVVLSDSYAEADQQKARDMGADEFRTKPMETVNLGKMLQEICARWLRLSHLNLPAMQTAQVARISA